MLTSSSYYYRLVIEWQNIHWIMIPGGHHFLWFHWPLVYAPGTMGEHTSLAQGLHCVTVRPRIGSKGTYERPGLRTHWRKVSVTPVLFKKVPYDLLVLESRHKLLFIQAVLKNGEKDFLILNRDKYLDLSANSTNELAN